MMSSPEEDLSTLPRFPLSTILSYLQQPSYQTNTSNISIIANNDSTPTLPPNRDALSLLLTTKRFAYAILPLFRVPRSVCRNYNYQTKDGSWITVVEKYRFAVLPIQDPMTLLDRLNTRRLRGRISWSSKIMSKVGQQHQENLEEESEGVEVDCENEGTNNSFSVNDGHGRNSLKNCPYYQYGRTTEELAFEEWALMKIDFSNESVMQIRKRIVWPAHLELLRFLDSVSSKRLQEQSFSGRSNKKIKRISSFRRYVKNIQRKDEKFESAMAQCNLLEEQGFDNGTSLLSSYPRSGNTLLRTLLERITSIVTGSDTRPDRTLSKSLALDHDLVGEGLLGGRRANTNEYQTKSKSSLHLQNLYQNAYEPRVHIVKTHFPERKGWKPVKGNSVLLLVRNPYDAIDSYWNLCCTNTHTRSLDESVYEKYAKKFEGLARHEIKVWCEFHYHWLDVCEEEGVPLLVVRYEDLVLDTEAEMLRVMIFLIGQQQEGRESSSEELTSFWEWRIRHALGKTPSKSDSANTSNLGSYQPRSSDGGLLSIGKSIRKKRYSESVLCHMHEVAVSLELDRKQKSGVIYPITSSRRKRSNHMTLLQQFGYDIFTQHFPDNFEQPPAIASRGSGVRKGTVAINNSLEIRSKDDPFGRAMTPWRRGETYSDTKPFPTIPR